MTEVQAEFDKLLDGLEQNIDKFAKYKPKLDELIAKGAKLKFVDHDYNLFWNGIAGGYHAIAVWYLDNMECSSEFIDYIVKDMSLGDGVLDDILRSKKCDVYVEKLMNHKDFDETVKTNLKKLQTPFEVKTEDSSNVQMEFDALYSSSHSDEKLIQNRYKLEELIAKGAKVKYLGTLLMDAIIAGTDPETAIWYLNHLEPCKDVIEDIVVICHEKFHPILEVVMRCNKCEYYLQKLAESDKVDSELRDTIKSLLKPQIEEKKLSEFDRYKIVVEFFKDADEYVEGISEQVVDYVLSKCSFDIKADCIRNNSNMVNRYMWKYLCDEVNGNPDILECLKVSDILNDKIFTDNKPSISGTKVKVQKHLIENCDQALFDYFVANKFAKTLDFMREVTKKQEGEHENAKAIRKMFKALG